MPITIYDWAVHRGVRATDDVIPLSEFERVGLAMTGGCWRCQATLAAYNAYPTHSGFWACADCVGDDGFDTVNEVEHWKEDW